MPLDAENVAPVTLALDAISTRPVDNVSEDPDDCTTQEQIAILRGREEVRSFAQDTGERKKYAKLIFKLTCAWVGGIYILLLLDGFAGLDRFHLPDSIVIAAIGSTTANIIGVFLIVTRYFFPRRR